MNTPEASQRPSTLFRVAVATAYVLLVFSMVSSIGVLIGRLSIERSVFDDGTINETPMGLAPLFISRTIPAGIGLWMLARRYSYSRGVVPAILAWLYVQHPASIIFNWIRFGDPPYWSTNQQTVASFFFFTVVGFAAVLFVAQVFIRKPQALEYFKNK